jgi:HK97 family phage prohead protease
MVALTERHANECAASVESAKADTARAYKALAQVVDSETVYERLRSAIAIRIQAARSQAHQLALAHVLAELRAMIGDGAGNVAISIGDDPSPADVEQYIDNAVETARSMVAAAKATESDAAAAFERAAYHTDTIIESEATNAYTNGRRAAESSLSEMSESATTALGFKVAKSESDLRAFDGAETRAEGDGKQPIVVVCLRWDSRSDACVKCRAAHGEIRPIGFSFSLPGPSAHARCQCITTLYAFGLIVPEREIAMPADTTTTQPNRPSPQPFLRAYVAVDDTREVDEGARTIRGCIASDETEDSHGSIIKANGWKLDRYLRNPVLIWAHKTGGWDSPEPEDVLGKTVARIDGSQLIADLQFDDEPKAETVFRKMVKKIIRGLSVGFVPLKYRWEKRDGNSNADEVLIIEEAELVEISVVPVPSNPNTLANQLREFQARSHYVEIPGVPATAATTTNAITVSQGAAPSPIPAPPEEQVVMPENKSHQVETLPAALAAVLGCQDVDSAVRAIADRDLAVKAATDKATAAEQRAADAESTVAKYREAEERAIVDMVEALIKSGREPESKRDALLVTAKAAPEAFRKLYPAQEEPPRKALLDRVVKPADSTNTQRATAETGESPLNARIAELRKSGLSYMDAYSRALNEYELAKASA